MAAKKTKKTATTRRANKKPPKKPRARKQPVVFVERVIPVVPGPAMRVRLFAPRKLKSGDYGCIAQVTDGTEVLFEKPLFGVDSLQALRCAAGIAHLMVKLRLVNRGAQADGQMLEDLAVFELTLKEPGPRSETPVE